MSRFSHPKQMNREDSPFNSQPIDYGQKNQYTQDHDTTVKLCGKRMKKFQEVVGVLLYYVQTIECTMVLALGTLPSAQSKATEATAKHAQKY